MKKYSIGIIGNPNSGKSTLFNALTGSHQHVGNWSGVTVERKTGHFDLDGHHISVIDLPGLYSLSVTSSRAALDEQIAADYLLSQQTDLIVNVIDASNLERNLYLTTQLLEFGIPMILVINKMDIAKRRGLEINLDELSKAFDCAVLATIGSKKKGICRLKRCIVHSLSTQNDFKPSSVHYNDSIEQAIAQLIKAIHGKDETHYARFLAVRLLEGDELANKKVDPTVRTLSEQLQTDLSKTLREDVDILTADARYGLIHELMQKVVHKIHTARSTFTEYLDKIILNRVLGIPIFLGVMYVMFLFAISVGGAFQDFFDLGSQAIFVQGLSNGLTKLHSPDWLTLILASGIGKGISTTLTFVPVLGAMFLFLALLENSGYMARASFVIDRLMSTLGLPGKSFVPMIVGFGCNVPAIMAARTLENQRDRILTIIMSPFMSCGARLAIYAVFTAAFFPQGGQNVVFSLYVIGILVSIFTGLILRKTLLRGEQSMLVMELPPYHLPDLKSLGLQTWHRLENFIFKAGKIIVPICLLLGTLNTVTLSGHLIKNPQSENNSALAKMGKAMTPLFKPIGITQQNWPATVGLITGVMAKEVVVATLNTLYTEETLQSNEVTSRAKQLPSTEADSILHMLKNALQTIPDNLKNLGQGLGNPVLASAPEQTLTQSAYGRMYERFNGQTGAFAYLLFILLYFPCIASVAAMFRELNWRWGVFSMAWSTGMAYSVSTLFYQSATFSLHPLYSSISMGAVLLVLLMSIFMMRCYSIKGET